VGLRPGDKTPMAMIEFVDYQLPETSKAEQSGEKVKGDKESVKAARAKNKENTRTAKAVRKIRAKSRVMNRR